MQVIIARSQDGKVSIMENDQRDVIMDMSHAKFKREFGFRLPKDSEDQYEMGLKCLWRIDHGKTSTSD